MRQIHHLFRREPDGQRPDRPHDYLPACGRDVLLPLYDPLTRLLGTGRMHRLVVDRAAVAPGERVLDLGTGTGGLALAISRACPRAEVVGLDPDPLALRRARRKRAAGDVRFDQGYAQDLPYPDASFDHVVSSFAFHHLPDQDREAVLGEALRVLRPGGRLHVLDVGGRDASAGDGGLARRAAPSRMRHADAGGALPEAIRSAGFADAGEVAHRTSRVLGPVTLVGGRRPAVVADAAPGPAAS